MKLEELLNYVQPTEYIVTTENYSDRFETPVLTAGKTFVLGKTNEREGIYPASKQEPVILFDDFTTASQWVDFPFKVKSSACKILTPKKDVNLKYVYYAMKSIRFNASQHMRYWISKYSKKEIRYPDSHKQVLIVESLDKITNEIKNENRLLSMLDSLIKSRFNEMFGDINDKNNGYTINDICVSIVRGPFGSSLKKEYLVKKAIGTYKVYEQKHAIRKNAFVGDYYINQTKFNELKRFRVQSGDFIMSCSGTIGELFKLPPDCEDGIINQALLKFAVNHTLVNDSYFLYAMKIIIESIDRYGAAIQNITSVSVIKKLIFMCQL